MKKSITTIIGLLAIALYFGPFVLTAKTETLPPTSSEQLREDLQEKVGHPNPTVKTLDSIKSVYVVPIQGPISKPTWFILRRSLKEAIASGVDTIVLDINTPGGELNTTVNIMKALDNFQGETFAYINDEAISAGAYIAVATQKIYFAPKAIIGAAAVIQGTGQDVDNTLKLKIDSYMRGNIARFAGEHPYRADVMRAMMDENYELVIDGELLKAKGELLTLWTDEAMKEYGDPPQALLGDGIVDSVDGLLTAAYGQGAYERKDFQITWSEELAQFISPFIPAVLGLGLLLLFIEFKTPGFGIFGISGIVVLLLAFLSNYVVGLAGQEPILFFLIGVILVAVELFFFPGIIIAAFLGILFILGALLWSMADIWPSVSDGISWNLEGLSHSLYNLLIGIGLAILGIILVWKFLPKTLFYQKLVLETPPPVSSEQSNNLSTEKETESETLDSLLGAEGVAITELHPGGEVDIDGKRYEAHSTLSYIQRGQIIRVVGREDFTILVEPKKDD